MGRLFLIDLEGSLCRCMHCFTHLALVNHNIVRKNFTSKYGRAYLFCKVVNVMFGKKEERMMDTGLYTVVDIHCVKCGFCLGSKVLFANEMTQKYKEGKFMIARCQLMIRCPPPPPR